jgi:hypothetical protein
LCKRKVFRIPLPGIYPFWLAIGTRNDSSSSGHALLPTEARLSGREHPINLRHDGSTVNGGDKLCQVAA